MTRRKINPMRRLFVFLAVASAGVALTGCATAPRVDLEPFAKATLELESQVRDRGVEIQASLQSAAQATSDPEVRRYPEKFKEEWKGRVQVVEALSEYTGALKDVYAAADESESNVKALADSAQKLGSALGVYGAIPNTVVTVATKLYAYFAANRAYNTVAEALQKADSFVQEIAVAIVADLKDLSDMQRTTLPVILLGPDNKHTKAIQEHNDYVTRQKELRKLLLGLSPSDPAGMYVELGSKIDVTARAMEPVAAEFAEYQSELETLTKTGAAGSKMLTKTADAVEQWAKVHKSLADGSAGRSVQIDRLLQLALDIRGAFEEEKQ